MEPVESSPKSDIAPLQDNKILPIADNIWCRIIALLQIVGGITGIGLFLYKFGDVPVSLILTLLFAPSFYSIFAGVMLWQGKMKGLNNSIIVQAIQIPRFVFSLVSFSLFIGLDISLGWFDSSALLYFNFGYGSELLLNRSLSNYGIGVNLVALVGFTYLWNLRRRITANTENSSRTGPQFISS